jgi:hypothetical protein
VKLREPPFQTAILCQQAAPTFGRPISEAGIFLNVSRRERCAFKCRTHVRAVSSVVEHFVHTEGVTGSNPVPPTKI